MELRPSEICDAMDELGLRPVIVPRTLFSLGADRAVSGPAYTLQLALYPADHMAHASGLSDAMAAIPTGSVVVIEAAAIPFAVWGGMMTTAAVQRGVSGVICSGLVRDTAQIRTLLPVFAAGVSPRRYVGRIVVAARNEPLDLGEAVIHPQDGVYADQDGIVIVRAADIPAVEAVARRIAEDEAKFVAGLRTGGGTRESGCSGA